MISTVTTHIGLTHSTGRRLARVVDNRGWIILNEEKPTLVTHLGARDSTIDLVMASPTLAAFCLSTGTDTWGSDHFLVSTLIQGTMVRCGKLKYKWNIGSRPLREFYALCNGDVKNLTDLPGTHAVEKYDALMEDLKHKLFHFIPKIGHQEQPLLKTG